MLRKSPFVVGVLICSLAFSAVVYGFGENVLSRTGQYTFFIQPEPGSCTTYYQKMVPCVVKETIMVPRKVVNRYPVPVPSVRRERVMISHTPVGCPEGSGPCVECSPKPSCYPATKDMIVPRIVGTPVTETVFVPKYVTRKVLLPQWFEVTEQPVPPKVIRKVGNRG